MMLPSSLHVGEEGSHSYINTDTFGTPLCDICIFPDAADIASSSSKASSGSWLRIIPHTEFSFPFAGLGHLEPSINWESYIFSARVCVPNANNRNNVTKTALYFINQSKL